MESTVNMQSVETMYPRPVHSPSTDPPEYSHWMMLQQRYMQENHPPDDFESPWEDEDHPENYSPPPTREENEDQQENLPPWEDEVDQREYDPAAADSVQSDGGWDHLQEFDEAEPLSVLLEILHHNDGDEEFVDLDREFVRVREMSLQEASERLCQQSNLLEETILKHLKFRQYRSAADQDGHEDDGICVVCQSEFEDKEILATIGCGHEYHSDCVKRWLQHKNVCPICKSTAVEQESS